LAIVQKYCLENRLIPRQLVHPEKLEKTETGEGGQLAVAALYLARPAADERHTC
jgi:hypothetical protein